MRFSRMMGTWLCSLAAATSCAAAPGGAIRIGINGHLGRVVSLTVVAPGKSRAVDPAGGCRLAEAGPGGRWTLSRGPDGRVCVALAGAGGEKRFESRSVRIEADAGGILRVGAGRVQRAYPGAIEVHPVGAVWAVVNEVPLESYLQGVLAAEVSARWHPEALKAIAIAARSYSERNRGRHGPLFDLCDTTHCHCYGGVATIGERIREAVAATAGVVALYEGRPIDAVYSADCGGRTQTVRDAWGSRYDIAYLRSVLDAPEGGGPEYCSINPRHSWSLTLSAAEMQRLLDRLPDTRVGTLRRVEAVGVSESGRPLALELLSGEVPVPVVTDRLPCELVEEAGDSAGAGGPGRRPGTTGPTVRQLPISRFRRMLGESAARGSMLQIEPTPDGGLRIEGKGFGHGVGLCQYGAQGMAAGYGKTHEEILVHYYPGVRLGTIPEAAAVSAQR